MIFAPPSPQHIHLHNVSWSVEKVSLIFFGDALAREYLHSESVQLESFESSGEWLIIKADASS